MRIDAVQQAAIDSSQRRVEYYKRLESRDEKRNLAESSVRGGKLSALQSQKKEHNR